MPLSEPIEMPNGHYLYWEYNEVGGRRYWSDEVGGGVVVWDTCLVSPETLNFVLKYEENFVE